MKQIEGYIRRACKLYNMIDDGDRVAVGVSGGKDSEVLLAGLAGFRRYSPRRFELNAVVLDPCFGGLETDYSPVEELCQRLGVPCTVRRSNIGSVVFEDRCEKNPCSLCARMRRGMLHDISLELGANKLALGHHRNDAVETLFLNLFYEGRLESFRPVTYMSRKNITVIRPLILAPEDLVARTAAADGLPVVKSRCPGDGHSKRQDIKEMIAEFEKKYPGFLERSFGAMQRAGISGMGTGEGESL